METDVRQLGSPTESKFATTKITVLFIDRVTEGIIPSRNVLNIIIVVKYHPPPETYIFS